MTHSYICDVTHLHLWVIFEWKTRDASDVALICDTAHVHVTRLIHICDMTHPHLRVVSSGKSVTYSTTVSYVTYLMHMPHDFMYVT